MVTSSCAAIYRDNADLVDAPGGVFTEEPCADERPKRTSGAARGSRSKRR